MPPTVARLAVVGGHNLLGSGFAQGAERRDVEAGDRIVTTLDCGSFVMLQRHGFGPYVPMAQFGLTAKGVKVGVQVGMSKR